MKLIRIIRVVFFICSYVVITAQTKITTYPAPEGSPRSNDFVVKVNGENIDLYGTETRYGSTASYGYFDFVGEVEIEVTSNHPAPHTTAWQILPGMKKYSQIKNGQIKLTINKPENLTFVVVGDYWGRTLSLFASAPETKIISKDDPNVIYFGPGYHDVGKEKNWVIELKENQTLYIAGGAYVKGRINATNVKNVSVAGHGILGQFNDMGGKRSVDFINCQNISISGIITNRNYIGWSGFIRNSRYVEVNDYKVVSPAIWSTDGLNLGNSSEVHFNNCYFRCGDDNIAIKGMGASGRGGKADEDPKTGLPNENILIENCIFWSDNNNAIVLGQESKAEFYKNITVRNCNVLFVRDEEPIKAVFALVCNNGTEYSNINFENITVGPSGQLITMIFTDNIFGISGSQKWPGGMHNITFKNINAFGAGSKAIRLEGMDENKTISNITFENVTIGGEMLKSDSKYFIMNKFVNDIKVK